jgi:hypothetical protein
MKRCSASIFYEVPSELTNPATVVTEDSFSKQFVHCLKIRAIFILYSLYFAEMLRNILPVC